MIGWFCYVAHLYFVALSLKVSDLRDLCLGLMRNLGFLIVATIITCIAVAIVMIYSFGVLQSDFFWLWVTIGIVFGLFWLLLYAICVFQFFQVLVVTREEIGWRLES